MDARAVLEEGEPRPMPDGTPPLGRAIRLFGNKYGYIAITAPPIGERLLLVSALDYLTSQIEEHRDGAHEPAFVLNASGVSPASSAQNIKQLAETLLAFAAEQKSALVERRKYAIYNTWLNLLNAKTELEQQRKRRIGYSSWEPSGSAIRFILRPGVDPSTLDEQDIRVEVSSELEFTGTVVSVSDDSVLVVPND